MKLNRIGGDEGNQAADEREVKESTCRDEVTCRYFKSMVSQKLEKSDDGLKGLFLETLRLKNKEFALAVKSDELAESVDS